MKKVLSILISILAICSVFTACASKKPIDSRQASRLIESYSPEELGVSEEDLKGAKFLTNSEIKELDGKKYYEIIISNLVPSGQNEKGEDLFTFDNIGAYYVDINGKDAYIYNNDTKELTKMPKKELPTLSPAEIEQAKDEKAKTTEK